MALVSGVGAGSGLDISALVTQLVQAEAAAPSAAINRREAKAKAQISALGSVKGAFAALQTAVNAFKSTSLFGGRSFAVDASDFVSVRSGGSGTAALGSFEVVVDTLASAQKLRYTEIASNATLDAGTLTLQVGTGTAISVTTDSETNTLRELAAKINAADGGRTLSASVLSSDTGESLVLTAIATGTANTISVTQTGGAGDLSALLTANPANYTELSAAQNSAAYIDGVLVTASGNTLSAAVAGAEITLKKVTDGVSPNPANARVTVTENISGVKTALQALVKAYNETTAAIATATSFDLEAKTAAALNGDALTRGAGDQIRRAIGQIIGASNDAGVDIGLSTDTTGKLSFDSSKFDAAYAAAPAAVSALVGGADNVISSKLGSPVDALLDSKGGFARRNESLTEQLKDSAARRTELERRLTQVEARYRKQFVALDSLLGKLGATSNYLSQQLANLPKIG